MKDTVVLSRPADLLPLLNGYSKKRQEVFGIICVDSGNQVIRKKMLFVGGDSKCQVSSRVVFWEACRASAAGVILFHNHPTGSTLPSELDIALTKELKKGFDFLGIQLLDHMIVGRFDYYSFLEHDMMPEVTGDKEQEVASDA